MIFFIHFSFLYYRDREKSSERKNHVEELSQTETSTNNEKSDISKPLKLKKDTKVSADEINTQENQSPKEQVRSFYIFN